MLKATVKNTPTDVKSQYVIARRNKYTAELIYYDVCDDEKQAYDIAIELDDGVVLEREDK